MPHSLAPLLFVLTGTGHLRTPDLLLIAVYLLAITLFGLRFRSKSGQPDRSLKTYFLAGNTIPWWAIALSVVSAETSTLTIVSIPGVAFSGNFGFLQVVLGYLFGRVVVALLFLPRYFAGEMLTAYQLIDRRFGPILHKVTAALFLLTRAAAEGVRVFAVSIVIGIAIGTGDVLSIALISALTLLYTFEGGMAAVIWTDVVQMAIYIVGTLIALLTLGHHVPGGWPTIVHTAQAANKFHLFNFALNLTQSYTFWAGLLGGTFLTMASHGTDQLMVQRLLAARNLRESQTALLSSGVVIFFQFAFFLLIGAGLWVFYGGFGAGKSLVAHVQSGVFTWTPQNLPAGFSPDRIFPTFIVHEMPTGIAGLLVAAILAAAMSNLSAALNSLSSTTVVDFYIRARPEATDRERTLIAKSSTAVWALVLFAIAIVSLHAGGKGHVVEIGLSIASVAYGCLLGVFLLGTLTRFATEYGAILGMICGFALNLWLWQGTFPIHLGPITIPHIAFTWYVLIGAAATFAIGALASLVLPQQRRNRHAIAASVLLISLLVLSSRSEAQGSAVPSGAPQTPGAAPSRPASTTARPTTPDFTLVSTLITNAIAQHQLPGAVVVIGHNGQIAFEHAYGDRKLAGEPGSNGDPTPAEPTTEDTIFDIASLTKVIVTATAIGQLYDQGRLDFDTPVEHYLPAFNPSHDPTRAQVTLRLLLTHFSGEPPDVNLKDPWGLSAPDKAEGLHRALTAPLANAPGAKMVYSDINFILLGAIVEQLSGQSLQLYATTHIFQPLGMVHTRYHAFAEACGSHIRRGAVTLPDPTGPHEIDPICPISGWFVDTIPQTAPTAHDDEGTPDTNPDFNHLLRGTVHDPTARRMGGVAGHAGVFSTAADLSTFAQALLDKLLHNIGPFPVSQATLRLMTTPQQPGHNPHQIPAAIAANQAALAARGERSTQTSSSRPETAGPSTPSSRSQPASSPNLSSRPEPAGSPHSSSRPEAAGRSGETRSSPAAPPPPGANPPSADPLLDPNFPAIPGQVLRGFGWDIDSGYSKPRGRLPIGSFGHTGFTGTSLWLDPSSDTYILLLSNSIHPHEHGPISNLRGEVATAAAQALGLLPATPAVSQPPQSSAAPGQSHSALTPVLYLGRTPNALTNAVYRTGTPGPPTDPPPSTVILSAARSAQPKDPDTDPPPQGSAHLSAPETPPGNSSREPTQTGIDVLESTHFAALTTLAKTHNNPLRLGLLTNQTGIDRHNRRTVDILATDLPQALPGARLTTLFSPEHGIFGAQDTEHLHSEVDPTTHIPVTSLYGAHDADRRPSHDQLKDLDAVLIDLQDAGVRFYTYETVTGYFLEAAAREKSDFHHDLAIVILDRPNPIGGKEIGGPISDPGTESYINYMPLPARHGLTLGELARYINTTRQLNASLTVVPLQHWSRNQTFADTGLPWVNPSPNLRTPTAELLYPATAFLEMTNLSVGRGTDHPFELFGAPGAPATSASLVVVPAGNPRFPSEATAANLTTPNVLSSRSAAEGSAFSPATAASTTTASSRPDPEQAERAEGAVESPAVSLPTTTPSSRPDPEQAERAEGAVERPAVFLPTATPSSRPEAPSLPRGRSGETPAYAPAHAPEAHEANFTTASSRPERSAVERPAVFTPTQTASSRPEPLSLPKGRSGETRVPTPATDAWFNAPQVAAALNARHIPGVRFEPTSTPVADDANHYPFHGQTIQAVRVVLTDPQVLDTSLLGLELLSTLHHLYPTQFQLQRANRLLCSQSTLDALTQNTAPQSIESNWQPALDHFRQARQIALLY